MEGKSKKASAERPSISMVYSAIAKHYEDELPRGVEVKTSKKYVSWGEDNQFPFFLYGLYDSVPTLSSIITSCQDYVCGDEILFKGKEIVNSRGETIEDVVREIVLEYALYGGFAIQIIRSKDLQEVAEIYSIPLRYLRTDENGEIFYYNEGFGEKWNKKKDIVLPKYLGAKEKQSNSILYVKGAGINTYPVSRYHSAIIPCVIEKEVNKFHFTSIKQGFMGSHLVNFCTGMPDPEQQAEIEKNFYEKFCGTENAGSTLLVWSEDKDHAPSVEKLDVEDFGAKYESLVKRAEQQIYASFRANPNLFGIPTENNGFSKEEYGSTFKLFNKTTILPMQKRIKSAFTQIFGEGSLDFVPFTIQFDE